MTREVPVPAALPRRKSPPGPLLHPPDSLPGPRPDPLRRALRRRRRAALRLLTDSVVDHININDINAGIAAFWRTITTPDGAEAFNHLINSTPVTIDQWHHQRAIYQDGQTDDLTLGFATFYLNRTNRSGILDARPIGVSTRQVSGRSTPATTSQPSSRESST